MDSALCSPIDVLDEIMDLVRTTAHRRGISISRTTIGPWPTRIAIDAGELHNILTPLVHEVLEAAHDSVSISMEFRTTEEDVPFLRFTVTATGNNVTRQVDLPTGPLNGVPLIHRHGGSETLGITPSQTASPSISLDCHVLLAEDSPDNQRLFGFLLRKAGARVTVVENGKEAVNYALAMAHTFDSDDDPYEPVDLILMDMQMPVMDGFDATRHLRLAGFDRPIIALTAFAQVYTPSQCQEAGCTEFARKPISRQQLLELVAKHSPVATSRSLA